MANAATALLLDDAFYGHDTGAHVEHPRRYRAIVDALHEVGMLAGRTTISHAPASDEAILRVHSEDHLQLLSDIAARGGGWIDPDTMVAPDSLDVARRAAGAGLAATEAVINGDVARAFALVRPPGHHATPERAMGFCLLNSIAIAAAHARGLGAERVAIIDWDVHHGNGTQEIFYEDPNVWYASIHQSPLYPGTGARSETGRGAGDGTVANSPITPGTGDADWLSAFDTDIAPLVERSEPDLIMLSAGYDAHADDPIGGCLVTDEGFAELSARTCALADRHCNGKLVVMLEGGYDPTALARSVIGTSRVMDGGQFDTRRHQ